MEVEGRLREDDVDTLPRDDVEHRVGEAGVRPGRHEVERVAQMPAHRPFRHVCPDQADVALAVLA
jgi:hypothetical protein